MRNAIITAAALMAVLGLAGAAQAQEGCSVSALNGKATAAAGSVDAGGSDETYELGLIAATPVTCAIGVQADLQASKFGAAEQYSGALHIFTRKPSRYLLGVTAGYVDGDAGPSASFAGVEGEFYADQWTVAATVGVAHSSPIPNEGLAYLGVSYYPTDNLRLTASNLYAFDNNISGVRGEWQPAGSNFSIFAEAQSDLSSTDLNVFKVGGRVYFGAGAKSLKDRHRQDDPESGLYTFGLNYNLTLAQFQQLRSGPGAGGNGPNGLPVPVNGVCPPGFFYVPSLSTTQCYI